MTIKEIRKEVKRIKSLSVSDYEAAHSAENSLWENVLETIQSLPHPDGLHMMELATEALKTKKIKFSRHTA